MCNHRDLHVLTHSFPPRRSSDLRWAAGHAARGGDDRARPRVARRRGGVRERAIGMIRLKLKRAYEPAAPDDGVRILIDRLWPRGVSKAGAALDEGMKEIAPSTELSKWFGHDPARGDEFQRRYRAELTAHPDELVRLRALAGKQVVTLVSSTYYEA